MKNFTTCICIMGLSGVAAADVLMDQIGPNDGTGIDVSNITANQDFEAAYDIYDIATCDDFNGDGSEINSVEMVLGGWNGFVDASGVSGWTVNLYSGADAAGASLAGDIASQAIDAADATANPDWYDTATFLMGMAPSVQSIPGQQWIAVIPANEFGTNGQTGVGVSTVADDGTCIQANPGGGFGFGPYQAVGTAAAYRVAGGAPADPCTFPLPETCAADVDGDGSVAVSDVLAIIGQWGSCGDGSFRPSGDVAPMPNGDCCVTVADVLAVVGSWGADCAVYGSCCMSDGSCSEMTDMACMDAGGSWDEGGDCATAVCVAAACCLSATSCEDLTSDACDALGGTYKGDGTACATTDCAAVEPGDECDNALMAVTGANAFDTTNTTASGNAPTDELCAGTFLDWGESQDIWFMYVSDGGLTTFDTCDAASYDTSLALYEGSCDNLVACNGDAADSSGCQTYSSEIANFDCVAGETYYVRIGAYLGDGAGPGTLNITPPATGNGACCFPDETCLEVEAADCTAFGGTFQGDGTDCSGDLCIAGEGDECADAITAVTGANPFDTTLYTPSTPEPDDTSCADTFLEWGGSPDVWMAWTADTSGFATFSTCDSASYDTSMVLYEGSCDNQVACNGDTTVTGDGCQLYYSLIGDYPVVEGEVYYIRLGGWQAATGAGTLTISSVGGDAEGACCMTDGSCMDYNASDCTAAGGTWDSTIMCADANCPQPFAGCPAGAEDNCDPCYVDGDDSTGDCNAGLNGATGSEFQAITLGTPVCGTTSVFVDGPTGSTYRDLDWFTNDALNAGGVFTISVGTSGADCLFGIVDNVAGAFVEVYNMPGGYEGSVTFAEIPAGDYSILVGANDWNVEWSCGSGNENYAVTVD